MRDANAYLVRMGHLACVCGDYSGPAERPWRVPGTVQLSLGFGLSVLAQALSAGTLPLASHQIGPGGAWTGVPFALMLLGALAATFPASYLLDQFGRRAAFALGASLGVAGGLVAAFALLQRDFAFLCLGAFWIGTAQGFGLFYRHAAATGPGRSGPAFVFAAGALAAVAGPQLAAFAEGLASPVPLLGSLTAAACVQIAALALAVRLPEPPVQIGAANDNGANLTSGRFIAISIFAALAWFVMTASMAASPLAMQACGIAVAGVTTIIAWHLLAMYLPGFFSARLVGWAGPFPTMALGLALSVSGAFWLTQAAQAAGFSVALGLVGVGWSITIAAATLALHAGRDPGPWKLAGHDAVCLAAAIAAAILSGFLVP